MKKILLLILAIVAKAAISQTTQFTPAMTNTLGGSGSVAGTYYDYTIGEPVIFFGGTNCDSIFSGFQHLADDTLRIKKVNINVGGTTTYCLGGHVTLTAPTGASYLWSTGATTQAITVAQTTQTGSYHVRVTNFCVDTIGSNNIIVTTLIPPVPNICGVTVDSLSQYNVIYWDKTSYPVADTFFVYRDTANNAYGLIGRVPHDSLSQFMDTLRTKYAADGNPNASTWKYKIAVKDTCGNISAKSPYHRTLFIQNSSSNFSWNQYEIEGINTGGGVPVPSLQNYLFQRDNLSTGNWQTIQTLSASSIAYTDPQYTTYQNTATWRVRTVWNIACTPTIVNPKDPMLNVTTVNTSKSNTFRINNPTFVIDPSIAGENIVSVYPNPNNGVFQVAASGSSGSIKAIEVYNLYGEKVYSTTVNRKQETVNLNEANGIYFLKVISERGTVVKKVVINH